MRILMKAVLPHEVANEAVRDGSFSRKLGSILAEIKPEAAYFTEEDGLRTGLFIVNMEHSSEMVRLAEPLFIAFHAEVSFRPVMVPEDLAGADPIFESAVKNYG